MGITSSVGLISGIDSANLIRQLLSIEARPKAFAQQRIVQLQSQQAAYLAINTSLMALSTAAARFGDEDIFQSAAATSSNEDILAATASTKATPGTYDFIVDRLVTTQRMLSGGFTDRDKSAFGETTLTIESAKAKVANDTSLSVLNGGKGVERGFIEITDRAGNTARIDLSRAASVNDVLDAINDNEDVLVQARVSGDAFVIDDFSGGAGNLIVTDTGDTATATSLGLAASVAASTLTGADVAGIARGLALDALNDGLGVLVKDGTVDMIITPASGDGDKLNINLGEITELVLKDDAEINGIDYEAGTRIDDIPDWSSLASDDQPETESEVVQARATTLGDVIDIINKTAADAGVAIEASISGAGDELVITDNTGGAGSLTITNGPSGNTADALGLTNLAVGNQVSSGRLVAGLNSVLTKSLNGGQGLSAGDITFTDRDGNVAALDIDTNGSLSDVIERLNTDLAAAGNNIRVSVNDLGNGLKLTDSSLNSGAVTVAGTLADELRIGVNAVSQSEINGGSAEKAWIGLNTKLDELNNGKGIGAGRIRITDGSGVSQEINIGGGAKTVDDLIRAINSNGDLQVTASLNDTGDGIKITDNSGANGDLKIEDVSGAVAKNLHIAGTYNDGEDADTVADGRFETIYNIGPGDTLDAVVNRINADQAGVRASVINDGSAVAPYRLSITALDSGEAGRMIVDFGDLDIGLKTVDQGQNARVFFGSDDPAQAVLLTSSDNTLDEVIDGVSIDLKQPDPDEVVTVNVARDNGKIEEAMSGFVDAFNAVITAIDKYDKYEQETETKGVLLGDSTVRNIKQMMYRTIQSSGQNTTGSFNYIFEIGVRIGDGAKLEFDAEKFREKLSQDPKGVEDLVAGFKMAPKEPIEINPGAFYTPTEDTFEKLGVAEQIELFVKRMTNSIDGLLTNKTKSLDSQIDLQEKRIERMDIQLASKQARLEAQFVAMEKALANMQSQQQALAQFPSAGF